MRLGGHAVRVVLDCDEEVFRLGYGDVELVRELRRQGWTFGSAPACESVCW